MSDDELQAEVLEELRSEPAARRARIYVRARDGTVTLSGQVSTFSEKQKLDAAVMRVGGLKALDTQISIKRFANSTPTRDKPGPIHADPGSAMPSKQADAAKIVKTAGLRAEAPRDVVNAIVKAVDARDGSDLNEVKLALSNFNLPTLLKPGATVDTLAKGLTKLEHSGQWPKVTRQCP